MSATATLEHDHYGAFDEHPHATIDLGYSTWLDSVQQVLEYRLGPPIAWEYADGTLYLWGEHFDRETLRAISSGCHDLEQEHAEDAIYGAAQAADRAESKLLDAEIKEP